MTPFNEAVQAIVDGDEAAVIALLSAHPSLVLDRASEPHQATLLHYIGANGIEPQRTPKNAPGIARFLLEAGADPNAIASIYGPRDTTLCLTVTSVHPFLAGVQADIVDALIDHGAKVDGIDDETGPLGCALMFGYTEAAERLVLRGARVDNLIYAAALGRTDVVRRMLADGSGTDTIPRRTDDRAGRFSFPIARDADAREVALIAAAMHGRLYTARALLEGGVPVNAMPFCGQTALHYAAGLGRAAMVDELLARGADPLQVDTQMGKTPAGWALESEYKEIAARLS